MTMMYFYKPLFRPLTDYRAPKKSKKKSYRMVYDRKTPSAEKEDLTEYADALHKYAKLRQRQREEDDMVISKLLAEI